MRRAVGVDGASTKSGAPRHELIVRQARMLSFLGAAATFLLTTAILSTLSIVVALNLGDVRAAWFFLWALLGSGVTLIAVGYVEGRMLA